MECEVCGRKIYGQPHKVKIEGAKLTVCGECATHGETVWEEEKVKSPIRKMKSQSKPIPMRTQRRKAPQLPAPDSLELVDDFNVKIRQSREKLGLSQEELGERLNEKVSVLKKLETGKMPPDNKLATKLERTLRIKLLVPASKKKVSQTKIPQPKSRKLTLGDLIQLDKKDVEEKTERKQS